MKLPLIFTAFGLASAPSLVAQSSTPLSPVFGPHMSFLKGLHPKIKSLTT